MGESHLRAYVAVLAALAVTLAASWVYWYGVTVESRFIWGTAVFAGLLLLADLFPIRVGKHSDGSTVEIVLMASVVMLGPFWAAVSALPYAVLGGRRDPLRTAYEASSVTVETYLAGIVFFFAAGPLVAGPPEAAAPVVYAALASGVTMVGVNKAINAGLLKIKYRQGIEESWREVVEPYLLSMTVSVLTVAVGVLVLIEYGPVAALVVIAGSIGSQVLLHRSREQVKENEELRARVGSLEEALATSNSAFGTIIIQDLGNKDGYTHRHAAATAVYAADLAREMKLDEARTGRLRMAGLLHNIGLFGLPEELLLANGRLNSIARSRLGEHPARGEETLAAVPEFKEMASWVRWHHERPDGRGYPDKLRGSWIPLEAKILAVAQAYAAMVLDQPSRPGEGFAEAREYLTAGIDTEFDGVVVRAFLRILDTESDGYRMADDYRFAFPAPDPRVRARQDALGPASDGQIRDLPL
ncbi:MAG TPA: HD domain-containing phosphohydrolase [Rubrobacteraceae bacterium]|nr:HD domain-containing phosphohydrolase [Rubrobacteraceae bacterium]